MPTFTAIALDRLLEPRDSQYRPKPKPKYIPTINPAFYATPDTTPLPNLPTSFPPSPYIINHKRRGPRLSKKSVEEHEGGNCDYGGDGSSFEALRGNVAEESEEIGYGFCVGSDTVKLTDRGRGDFFESRDLSNCANVADGVDTLEDHSSSTQGGEFYDAWDELSSDGGTQSSLRDIEADLRELRISLLTEIESRKQADEAVNSMREQWEKISKHLLLVGLTLPAYTVSSSENNEQQDAALVEELCQKISVARYVSESIGRAIARAEAEVEMEAQIESKNFEISRLTDRLSYYEAMNHEMCRRNQEAIEMARRNWQERKRNQKWIWGSVAAAITIGTAALLWSYVPYSGEGFPSINQDLTLEETDSSS